MLQPGLGWAGEMKMVLHCPSLVTLEFLTLLLKQSFGLFIPPFPGMPPWLYGQQNEGHQFLEAGMLPPHNWVSLQNGQSCPKYTQPDSHGEE